MNRNFKNEAMPGKQTKYSVGHPINGLIVSIVNLNQLPIPKNKSYKNVMNIIPRGTWSVFKALFFPHHFDRSNE